MLYQWVWRQMLPALSPAVFFAETPVFVGWKVLTASEKKKTALPRLTIEDVQNFENIVKRDSTW